MSSLYHEGAGHYELLDGYIAKNGQEIKSSGRFPRIKVLIKNILDPQVQFGAVLGAGISVSAGFSAFRYANSVFAAMYLDYENWPGRDGSEDSFLMYAFSVQALRNDPRVQYRVLHSFEKSMQDKVVLPTLSHIFLRYLAEAGKLKSVVTYNIDNLEISVGLERMLGPRLIQAHGSFSKQMVCINKQCPGYTHVYYKRETTNTQQISHECAYKLHQQAADNMAPQTQKYRYSPFSEVLVLDYNMLRFNSKIFEIALLDDCVPICPLCGTALKSSMVLYEEATAIPEAHMATCFSECKSLLIIGTSLNVAPVNYLPGYLDTDASIHLVAKEINFKKYLTEHFDTKVPVFNRLIDERMSRIKYRHGDEHRYRLMKYLTEPDSEPLDMRTTMNLLTPLFNYHQGDCDELVKEVLANIPDAEYRCAKINSELEEKCSRNHIKYPNYTLSPEMDRITFINTEYELKIYKVMLAIPYLWQPDAAIYNYDTKGLYCSCVIMTDAQIELVRRVFSEQIVEYTVDGVLMLVDKRFGRGQRNIDYAIYYPIGGHWSLYCVAYNYYRFEHDNEPKYHERYDPWSMNFIGYYEKELYYNRFSEFYVYYGVWRNFHYMHEHSPVPMVIDMRMSQAQLLPADAEEAILPEVYGQCGPGNTQEPHSVVTK